MIAVVGVIGYVLYDHLIDHIAYINSTEYLVGVIDGKDPGVSKVAAIDQLANRQEPAILPALSRALDDLHSNVRSKAVEALAKRDDPAVLPPLIHAMSDRDADVRWAAVEALAKRDDPAGVPALVHATSNDWAPVRKWAIEHLPDRRDPTITSALLQAAEDKDRLVREAAFDQLRTRKAPEALSVFVGVLDSADTLDRLAAARNLGKLASPEALNALIEALPRQDDPFVIEAFAQALSAMQDARAVPPLLVALTSAKKGKGGAFYLAKAIVELEPQPVVLGELLRSKDWFIAENMGKALGYIANPQGAAGVAALEVLNQALVGKDLTVGRYTYHYYIDARRADAVEYLEAVLGLYGDEAMAKVFLHSGNSRLEQAASSWANSHGYRVEFRTVPGSQITTPWGNR